MLAGQRALNILAEDTPSSSKVGGLTTVGAWFATGTFLLAAAVVAHILGGRAGGLLFKLHYALALIAVVIISIGVAVAASQRNAKLQQNHGGHYYVGYVTLGWLWLQAIFGAVLWRAGLQNPDLKTRVGWTHRISAVLLFALLLYLFFTVALQEQPFSEMSAIEDWVVVSAVLVVIYLVLTIVVVLRLPARLKDPKTPTDDTLMNSLF